jgi:hypothetical protein
MPLSYPVLLAFADLEQRGVPSSRRPCPVGASSNAELAEHIRQHIAASRLHGEGYRKLWAGCALLALVSRRKQIDSREIEIIDGLPDWRPTTSGARYTQTSVETAGTGAGSREDRCDNETGSAATKSSCADHAGQHLYGDIER